MDKAKNHGKEVKMENMHIVLWETGWDSRNLHRILGVFSSLDVAIKTCDLINTTTTSSCAVYVNNEFYYDSSEV